MKYTLELEIAAPPERVAELYDNLDTWKEWQESLISAEPISGKARAVGSKTRLLHRFGRKNTEMVETIEAKELPHALTYVYEADNAWNRVVNRFDEIAPGKTRWSFESEFKCGGMLRIMGALFPGIFRRASLKEMRSFKDYVERAATS